MQTFRIKTIDESIKSLERLGFYKTQDADSRHKIRFDHENASVVLMIYEPDLTIFSDAIEGDNTCCEVNL